MIARAAQRTALIAGIATLLAAPAHAELVNIVWDSQKSYQHKATLAPGKFLEVCGKLEAGQKIEWHYRTTQASDFNIHYHEGKKVVTPVEHSGRLEAKDVLTMASAQETCWMWTNKARAVGEIWVRLVRR